MDFLSCHLLFDHTQLTLIHGLNIPSSCATLFFIASNLSFTTRYNHNYASFPLWLSLFILSGAISLLYPSRILGTYQPERFIFPCHIFLTFHTVHGVLKARILKWFAIPFSCRPRFVRTLYHDPSILGGPTQHWIRDIFYLPTYQFISLPPSQVPPSLPLRKDTRHENGFIPCEFSPNYIHYKGGFQ